MLKREYGIDKDGYENLLKLQNGKCAICGLHEQNHRNKVLNVDHNHKTKKVRGLLCNNCNRGLGHLKDNILFLENALAYLKEKGAKMSLYRVRPIWPGERYLIKAKVTSIKNNLYELEIIPQSKEFVYKRSTKFPYLLESTILGEFIIGTGNYLVNAVREKDLLVSNF
jgi:hypothetical protein